MAQKEEKNGHAKARVDDVSLFLRGFLLAKGLRLGENQGTEEIDQRLNNTIM